MSLRGAGEGVVGEDGEAVGEGRGVGILGAEVGDVGVGAARLDDEDLGAMLDGLGGGIELDAG